MRIFLLTIVIIMLSCAASKDLFLPEKGKTISSEEMSELGWKLLGLCDSTFQLCVYMDTLNGDVINIRRLEKKKFLIMKVKEPTAVDELKKGAFLTGKFREKKLVELESSFFTITYETKRRPRLTIGVDATYGTIKEIRE